MNLPRIFDPPFRGSTNCQGRPYFDNPNRRVQWFKWPNRYVTGKPFAQTIKDWQSHQCLRSNRPSTGQLPQRKGPFGTGVRDAILLHSVPAARFAFARQVRNVTLQSVSPERSNTRKQSVQFRRHIKSVVAFRCIFNPVTHPIPYGKRVRRPGHRSAKSFWVPERKIKPQQQTFTGRYRCSDFLLQPSLSQFSVSQIDRRFHLPVSRFGHPNRVLARSRAGIVSTGPVHHYDPVPLFHSPTSAAMKSAMAFVSFRSKTGHSTSSGVSDAIALIIGSSGAINGFFVSARNASIFAC